MMGITDSLFIIFHKALFLFVADKISHLPFSFLPLLLLSCKSIDNPEYTLQIP